MSTWVILATGQSLNQETVDYVKDKATVVVVSDAYLLAPWADYLISSDNKWWMANPDAFKFKGQKYARYEKRKVKAFRANEGTVNSGLLAMYLALHKGARKIILLGFDMHGTHFFGKHTKKWGNNPDDVLVNTTPERFKVHLKEFEKFTGCEVINCTPDSALKIFPFMNIRDIL